MTFSTLDKKSFSVATFRLARIANIPKTELDGSILQDKGLLTSFCTNRAEFCSSTVGTES